MVLQQQFSEQPTKLTTEMLDELQPTTILSSNFKDQHRDQHRDVHKDQQRTEEPQILQRSEDNPLSAKKVSTMRSLGAPKTDDGLHDKYKQMLMAKLDIKTIQRRKRPNDKSQEHAF